MVICIKDRRQRGSSLRHPSYESEFTRIRSYIVLSPRKIWPKNGLLTGCSRNFDPIIDPIIISKCSQWGFLRLRITVGRVGDGKKVYYKMYLGSITLMKPYTALFAAIGGRDGMDAGGVHQMTCAIYGTRQPSGAGRSRWAYFFIAIHIYICIGGWDVLEHEGMRVSVIWCYLQARFQNALSVKEMHISIYSYLYT
jgi:hypothetical protein